MLFFAYMQGFWRKSFEKVDFVRKMLFCGLWLSGKRGILIDANYYSFTFSLQIKTRLNSACYNKCGFSLQIKTTHNKECM